MAEAPQPAPEAATAQVSAAPIQAAPAESEADAKAFIYFKESTNRLDAHNSSGCKGLGQDCNGQLVIDCPNWQTDYPCQDVYFKKYMQHRYKTWMAAKAHWLARVPINGRDVGNWW